MSKRKIDPFDVKILKTTEEGRLYLKYNDIVGGDPLGLMVPGGYPNGVEERGGVMAVYRECIEKGITWEELLDFEEDDIIY